MSDQSLPNVKIIDRIIKMLRLAEKGSGATEHEALVAATKAQEMLQEYGLSMAEIEASGGKVADDGKREKTTIKRSSMYKWQRELMEMLAETNFCMHRIHEEYDPETRRRSKRHQLIGRTVNVMYDYLVTTMKRLVSEAGHAPGNHSERDYHFWLEGCSERLCERLKDKAKKAKEESERKKREDEKRRQHPSYAGATGTALVLADVYTNEDELNQDFERGLEPGTTTRERLAREEATRKRDAKYQELLKTGMDDMEAWYNANGYSPERAKALVEQYKKNAEEDAKRAAKSSRRRSYSSGPRYSSWTKADQREEDKRNSSSYRAGTSAGSDIGLDPQVDHEQKKRLT